MTTVIAGAGVGGLAAAIALAARGEPVTVLERQRGAGGKMLPALAGGHSFDSGPTVLTILWVFEELFRLSGSALQEHVKLQALPTLARHYWTGGASLDLFADRGETADAIGHFAGKAEAEGYLAFAQAAARIHQALLGPFLKSQKPTPWGLTAAMPMSDVLRINPFESLWSALGRHFKDKRLQQLFGRYATYCGSSPFKAPATLMLVADVEAQGVWRVEGGMASLAQALEARARALGVAFHFNCGAARVETTGGRITSVIDEAGNRHGCTSAIINADSAAVAAGLFGPGVAAAAQLPSADQRSLSAVTWCGVWQEQGVPLAHHSVFFSDDYRREFAELESGPAQDPTVYVCDQGEGRKLVLVNAPADGAAAPEDCAQRAEQRLQRCGLEMQLGANPMLQRGPQEFATLYPATHGALYGRASHGWMSTFQRPQARTKIPGLYLAGGSTHPGPGVPMAALAGLRAAEALMQDRVSTRR